MWWDIRGQESKWLDRVGHRGLVALVAGTGVQLDSDARPSRDRELQKNASLPLWVPAPCCLQDSGLALGPEKAKQVRALLPSCQGTGGNDLLTAQIWQRGSVQKMMGVPEAERWVEGAENLWRRQLGEPESVVAFAARIPTRLCAALDKNPGEEKMVGTEGGRGKEMTREGVRTRSPLVDKQCSEGGGKFSPSKDQLISIPYINSLSLLLFPISVQRIRQRKTLIMANVHQENDGIDQPMQNGEENRPLGRGEGHQPAGNRRGQAHRLAPNFRWAIPNRQVNDGLGGDGDDMEIFMEEMREIRRKLRELQLRNCLRILMGELSNHREHHDEFCLIP
ncbi:uncharacterized protein LOC125998902 [Suncus etruscus]|uniref:uncharacterized protein LOC125998902 n=1 Tax=Suncus etruscus TaxID=109475 RepID=UPI00211021FD|nr:uncharacterized protein LOC125998902 [Suncus etruscus]